jgi:HPt (histidine-containing phosphotransfer) domain-containing protein
MEQLAPSYENRASGYSARQEPRAFDFETLVEQVGGEVDIAHEVLQAFVESSEGMSTRLRASVDADCIEAVGEAAHAAKGALLAIGAARGAELARTTEEAARSGERSICCETAGELSREVDRVAKAAAYFLRG